MKMMTVFSQSLPYRLSDRNDHECVFTVTNSSDDGELPVLTNGQLARMLIDSGATCNIVGTETFSCIQTQSSIHVDLKQTKKRVFPYGSKTPLAVEGLFTVNIKAVDGLESAIKMCY